MSMTDDDFDEVDTSTNEEALDESTSTSDDEWDTDETSFETESTEESADTSEELEEQSVEDGPKEEAEETEEASEESEEETLQDEESKEEVTPSKEEQKRLNDLYAQRRIAEKQVKEEAKRQAQAEYLQSAEDDQQLAVRQLQIDAYNNRVQFNQDKLQSGIDRALANIDLFTKGTPEVKQELLRAVDDFERMNVKYDQNGDPVEVTGDVYQHLTERADSIRRLMDVGARQSAKDKSNAKTRTIVTPSKTPKQPKVDPDLDAFDEEVKRGW